MLSRTYFPSNSENRMKHEGDVAHARQFYFKNKPSNLTFLLKKRFGWMNQYIKPTDKVVEVGAGPGFSREFINKGKLILTDYLKHPWIDKKADALNMPFKAGSVDVIISTHMIHHLAHPLEFFNEMAKVLKPGGLILVQEINTSFLMRALLYVMRHEGYALDVNVFDKTTVANDPADPWSANCAIPQLLFSSEKQFEKHVPQFKIIHNKLVEGFIFPLSGGVTAKTKTINLPFWLLKIIDQLDTILIALLPSLFALGRQVVLQKRP